MDSNYINEDFSLTHTVGKICYSKRSNSKLKLLAHFRRFELVFMNEIFVTETHLLEVILICVYISSYLRVKNNTEPNLNYRTWAFESH